MNTDEELAAANRRSVEKLKAGFTYFIEGAYYSSEEIAARLGVAQHNARKRLRNARKLDGPVTWAKLGETK